MLSLNLSAQVRLQHMLIGQYLGDYAAMFFQILKDSIPLLS